MTAMDIAPKLYRHYIHHRVNRYSSTIIERMRARVTSLMPLTSSNCSSMVNPPSSSRNEVIAAALTSPTPSMASAMSTAEAVLRLMGNTSSAQERGVKDPKVIVLTNSSRAILRVSFIIYSLIKSNEPLNP